MEFCGNSDLWNVTYVVEKPWPQLTNCFQETVLTYVPCGWLFLTSIVHLIYLRIHKRYFYLPTTWLSIIRLLCGFTLALLASIQAIDPLQKNGRPVPASFYVSKVIWAVTFLYAVVIMVLSHRRGISSPCIVFIFWTLALVSHIVPTYTALVLKTYETGSVDPYLAFFVMFILIIEFILQCAGDFKVLHVQQGRVRRPCYSTKASFSSKATFSWVFSLIYVGYKNKLTKDDLTDLPPDLQCRNVLPDFTEAWNKELRNNMLRNRRSRLSHNGHTFHDGDESLGTESEPNEKTRFIRHSEKTYSACSVNSSARHVPSEEKTSKPSLYHVLMKVFYPRLFKAQMVGLMADMLQFLNPLLLGQLIDYVENKENYHEWQGLIIALAIFLVVFLSSVMINFRFYNANNVGIQVKTVLVAAIYKKSLTMNAEARRQFTVGTIVNLMAVDSQRFQDLTVSLWAVISWPVQTSLAFYLLYQQVGLAFLSGIGVLLLLIPVNARISSLARRAAAMQIYYKDLRIKLMNEALNGIKVLKLYAWELPYQKKVDEVRKQEVKQLKLAAVYQSLNIWSWLLSPVLVTVSTLITYVLISHDGTLTPSKAFVSLTIFNLLKQPMNTLPVLIAALVQCHVSMERIRNYLAGENLEKLDTWSATKEFPIMVRNGTFTWDRSLPPLLKNITFQIPKKKLVAVIGQVGAGKSSLLSALLGEMERETGFCSTRGSVGYVPQQAWIQNATLRDNILFGKSLDWKRYKETIRCCALEADLQVLAGGELTEIGEKGINLSGGQKQRISLGRAVYQNCDTYLLDDPLSAVDAHVGKHIFDNVIGSNGMLKNKTRILVTHGVHWLPLVDSIIVIDQGQITESGTYQQLMSHDGPFAQFVKAYLLEHEDEEIDDPEVLKLKERVMEEIETVLSDEELHFHKRSVSYKSDSEMVATSADSISSRSSTHNLMGKQKRERHEKRERYIKRPDVLIQEERTETGKVKYTVFLHLFRALGFAWLGCILVALMAYNALNIAGGIWLSKWTGDSYLVNNTHKDEDEYKSKTSLYIAIYTLLSLLQVMLNAAFILLLLVQFVNASQRMHNSMLSRLLCQAMEFFDTTPLGRILNRFSRDVDVLDTKLSRLLRIVLQQMFSITSIIIIISYTAPIFIAFMIPILVIYVCVQKFYIPSFRQYRRLESITRSPIYSQFAETINGASSIRAYNASERFVDESINRVDLNNQCFFIGISTSRWLRIRLELLGNCIVMFTAFNAVLSTSISGSLVGLSLSYALQITQALNILVQQYSQLESNSVSAERIVEYSNLPPEPDWIIKGHRPSLHWPEHGQIEFMEYSTRYRTGLDLVLKSISFKINAGEKVGIVGRTGAGKSSLSMALFRVIEAASGKIVIDDIDISTMGLHDLRSHLTILPQDPVLFSGTLRFNLDPFDLYSDDEVWSALDHAHLGKFVREFPGLLEYICEEGGQNLSVGQRQLVCLARSLLRKTKILVLDEATAAVDLETDHLLQQTIREAFKECTVLTVAHRLNTVIDYDRILVLSEGEIVEYDTPASLLDNKGSVFYGMAREASLV